MLVVNRFRVPLAAQQDFRARLETAHGVLAAAAGYGSGEVGRNLDEPELWVLVTRWADVGSYRRALSSYDAKLHVAPVLGEAIDEASAFEAVGPGVELNVRGSRGE